MAGNPGQLSTAKAAASKGKDTVNLKVEIYLIRRRQMPWHWNK
jgi:hypothetical protein